MNPAIFLLFYHLLDIGFVAAYHNSLDPNSLFYKQQYESVYTFDLNGRIAWKVYAMFLLLTGAMLTGALANSAINSAGKGWLIDGNSGQMLIQLYDVLGTFIYCGIVTFIILKAIDMTIGLRVSKQVEVEGLDINLHGETVHG